jgi:hypothetical protein
VKVKVKVRKPKIGINLKDNLWHSSIVNMGDTKTLDDTAIQNLIVLAGLPRDMEECRVLVEDNRIQRMERSNDDYEHMFSMKELSYPVSFSFYRVFQLIESDIDHKIRMNYLDLLDRSLDNIHYLMNHTEEEATTWISLKMIVNDLEDRYSILYGIYTRKSLCDKVQGSLEDFFLTQFKAFVKVLSDSRKYLYLTPMTYDLEEWIGEDDSDSDSDSDDRSPRDAHEPPPSDSGSGSDSDSGSDSGSGRDSDKD